MKVLIFSVVRFNISILAFPDNTGGHAVRTLPFTLETSWISPSDAQSKTTKCITPQHRGFVGADRAFICFHPTHPFDFNHAFTSASADCASSGSAIRALRLKDKCIAMTSSSAL